LLKQNNIQLSFDYQLINLLFSTRTDIYFFILKNFNLIHNIKPNGMIIANFLKKTPTLNIGGNIMKPTILLLLFTLIFQSEFIAKTLKLSMTFTSGRKMQQKRLKRPVKQKATYKNGAREIIFIDRDTVEIVTPDSTYLLAQANDSTEYAENEEGYYLNEFKGSQSDLEYAERIRRFHNPKYTIFIGDPNYNDIYFLDNFDWNVYVDGSYAYITPTWTNPYWFDYAYRPYSYNSWYWRNSWYSPYSYYGGWGYNPWSYNYYGGWGYPYYGYYGYYDYGWGSPYYYGYGYNNYWGGGFYNGRNYNRNNPAYNEANRRSTGNARSSEEGSRRISSTTIGGSGSRTSLRNSQQLYRHKRNKCQQNNHQFKRNKICWLIYRQ